VEGWAYTERAFTESASQHVGDRVVSFWDAPRLLANDTVFEHPSAGAIAILRDRYGVTWLFADLTTAAHDLGDYAREVYRAGRWGVFSLA